MPWQPLNQFKPALLAAKNPSAMTKKPTIKPYLDDEERDLIEALESNKAQFKSIMTPTSRKAVVKAARAAMNA
jgi:hypothetical protein